MASMLPLPLDKKFVEIIEPISPSLKKTLDHYKNVICPSEKDYCAIADSDFVRYVKIESTYTLTEVLQKFLGARVEMFDTYCISLMVFALFSGLHGSNHHPAIRKPCKHQPREHAHTIPEHQTYKCMKTFVRSFRSRLIVVCCSHKPDYEFYKLAPNVILITPDQRNGIKIESVPTKVLNGHPPPEIKIMEDYAKNFGFRPPFRVVCDQDFEDYVKQTGSGLIVTMEALLGGEIELQKPYCITGGTAGCGHTVCTKIFVREFSNRALVVCTVKDKDRECYARVPGRIVVTHNAERTGILIDTQSLPSMVQHIGWIKRAKCLGLKIYERLFDEILKRCSNKEELPLKVIVSQKNGKEKFQYTSASGAAKKMLEIASAGMGQPEKVLDGEGFDFDMSLRLQENEEDEHARIEVNKAKGKGKIDDVEMIDGPCAEKAISETGGRAGQGRTVYVKIFGNDDYKSLRDTIVTLFPGCGDISDISICRTGQPKGHAFIKFADFNGFKNALALHGTPVGSRRLVVRPI